MNIFGQTIRQLVFWEIIFHYFLDNTNQVINQLREKLISRSIDSENNYNMLP